MPKPNKGESKQEFLKRCTGEVVHEGKDSDQAYAMCNAFWDDSNNQRSIMLLKAPVEMAEPEKGKSRQFAITGYTGQKIDSWWGSLIFSVDGMKTKEKIPVLREHARDRVVGYGKAWTENGNFYVSGGFSGATKDSKEVLDLADEGYPWQASVGIWPRKIKVLENSKAKATVNGKEYTGPLEIWEESDVGEVSFVSLGRDDNTAAISFAASEGKVPVHIERFGVEDNTLNKEEMTMDLEKLKKDHPDIYNEVLLLGKKEGVTEERVRVVEIINADADQLTTKKVIEDGVAASDAYKLFFKAEREKKSLGLKNLEAEATSSVGVNVPEEPKPKKDQNQTFNDSVTELMTKKGMTYLEATRAIQNDPDFLGSWKPIGIDNV
ncbi:MAG: hypothetical protein KJP23_10465 [Deltaproteobacteria bacterium]|nr:hypothetical protein [Deltaproteobacteria bacterium]